MADPLQGFKFKVNFGGDTYSAGFMRISGINMSRGERRWTEITDTHSGIKLPDVMQYNDITFSSGIYLNGSHGDVWFDQVSDILIGGYTGKTNVDIRKTVLISVYEKGSLACREFYIRDAYPKAIRIGDIDAMTGSVIIRQLVVAHEGIVMAGRSSSTDGSSYFESL